MVRTTRLTLAAAAATVLAATALAQPAREGGQTFTAALTPGAEVPGPGFAGASGTVTITINPGQQRLCWDLTTAGVPTNATGIVAHIHSAFSDASGPIVIHLTAGMNTTTTGCANNVARHKLDAIRKAPQVFYVNVHWQPGFGAGAIRGQLG